MLILGMDLGQSKSAWGQMDTASGEYQTGWVTMDEAALVGLLERLQPDQLVVESGPLAARVYDLAVARQIKVVVADVNQTAWSWKHVKRKTDPDDALKLVRLALLDQLNPVHVPTPEVRQLRGLLRYRRRLVAEQTRRKNRIRATLLCHTGRRLAAGHTAWTLAARAALLAELKPLEACDPEELWKGQIYLELQLLSDTAGRLAELDAKLAKLQVADPDVQRVASLPGVGRPTAQIIVAVLDGARRFRTRRQVSAYAGLVPRRFQSGELDRSGRITKRGNRLLRWALNQAAWVAVRCSPHWRELYLRLGGGSKKRRKQAIVALMRKLLVVAWALLRDQSRYDPQRWRARPAAA